MLGPPMQVGWGIASHQDSGEPANESVKFDSNSTSDFCVGMMLMSSVQVVAMVE